MIPDQERPLPLSPSAAEVIFNKLPSNDHRQQVEQFCQVHGLGLEDAIVILLMRGVGPGQYFMEQLPGEAEQQKLRDYCSMENLSPDAALLSILNRALEQSQVLEEARKSPFIAQAQQQLGAQVAAPTFVARHQKACYVCGTLFKPRNMGQLYCDNGACWAAGAGLVTDAERNRQSSMPTQDMSADQRFERLEGMFMELMRTVKPQQQAR